MLFCEDFVKFDVETNQNPVTQKWWLASPFFILITRG